MSDYQIQDSDAIQKAKPKRCIVTTYLFLCSFIPLYVYIGRNLWGLLRSVGTLGPVSLLLLPFILLYLVILIFIGFTFIGLTIHRFWKFRSYKSSGRFLIWIIVAMLIPLIVDARTDGAKFFYEHRAAFENVVQLVRQNKLNAKTMPAYAEIVLYNPLTIIVNSYLSSAHEGPTTYEYAVYTENPEALQQVIFCSSDGYIHGQLDKNWWTCFMDWN